MKRKSRILALILALVLCVPMLISCGKTEKEPESKIPTMNENGEVFFERDGQQIYGKLVLPEGEGPFPVVVIAHAYGATHIQTIGTAEKLAENGIAAYVFDFIGGSRNGLSGGKTTEMSILTEAADMTAVLEGIVLMPEIDPNNVFVWGYSQGGLVASYVAAKNPETIKAAVLYFPAYSLQDDMREIAADPAGIPDELEFMPPITVGRVYIEDGISFDIYDLLPNYTNDVWMIHGTADFIVPYEYSVRAAETFPSAQLTLVEGGSHGNFAEEYDDQAIQFVKDHIE